MHHQFLIVLIQMDTTVANTLINLKKPNRLSNLSNVTKDKML